MYFHYCVTIGALCRIIQVRSRPSPGPEGVHDDANERIVLRNTSSTPRRHQNPSPSSTPSMSSLQRADHSQMNHVGPPQPSRRPARSSVTPTGSTLSVPDTGDQQRRLEPGDRRSLQWSVGDNASWTDVDAEIPADAAATNEGAGATEKPAEGPEVTADHPRLEARPSLRLRRHFDCPDLVLINRNPSAEDVATACTPRAEPVPPPPPQRPLPPSFSSSSSSGPTSASRLPRRRLTLPGIIKYDPPVLSRRRPGSSPSSSTTPVEPLPAEYIAAAAAPAVDERSATPPTTSAPLVDAGFGVRGGRPATEMYLVENCARKRLQEERLSEAEVTAAMEAHNRTAVASILDTPSLDGLDPPRPLAMRYRQVVFSKRIIISVITSLLNSKVTLEVVVVASRQNMRTAAILIFDKCLSPRQTTDNNCKTAFSLHVVEIASADYNF